MNTLDFNEGGTEQERVLSVEQFESEGDKGVPALIGMLSDPSWVVRRSVVKSLAALGEATIAPLCKQLCGRRDNEARIAATVDTLVATAGPVETYLGKLLDEPNPAIVADVAQILGRRRNPASIPQLIKLVLHPDDNVAVGAIEGLGRIGGRAAIGPLIEATATGNFFRTFPAIDILGRSGDPRVVEPLVKLLANPNFLIEAIRALGRSGEKSAIRPLLDQLESPSLSVARVAVVALSELLERFAEKSGGQAVIVETFFLSQIKSNLVRRLSEILAGADAIEATCACKLLGIIGNPEAIPLLTAKLDEPPQIAEIAASALKRIGREADGPLVESIRQGNSARRLILLPLVSRTNAAKGIALCLEDPDPQVRALTCETLARLGNSSVVEQIFSLLGDKNLRVVHSAVAAVQSLGSRQGRSLAMDASESENPAIRRSALNILSYFGEVTATDPLIRGLEDSDPRVREAAVQGLPYLEDVRALEALFETSKHEEARMRALAMRSLGQIPKGNERVYSVLLRGLTDADSWVRYHACQSLGRLEYSLATPEIASRLADEAGQVRVAAVEALSHFGTVEAQVALRAAANSDDVDVKRVAIVGLGILHRDEDLPTVLCATEAPDAPTRLLTLSALVRFSSSVVLEKLRRATEDSDEQVRSAAIGFLAASSDQKATEILVGLLGDETTRDLTKNALLVPSAGRTAGLLVALESSDDERAPVLIAILGKMKRPESKVGLLSAMKLSNPAARKAAAIGLAGQMDSEMTAVLAEAAKCDPNPEVRQICALLSGETLPGEPSHEAT